MSTRWRRLCGRGIAVLAVVALPVVFAYNAPGKRWSGATTTLHTGIPGTSSSGTRWSAALAAAMQQWTTQTPFQFVASPDYVNPCNGYTRNSSGTGFPSGNGDQINGADFRSNVCGNDFGSGVLAITLTYSSAGPFGFDYIHEADMVFNDSYNWDVYNGAKRTTTVNGQSQSLVDFGRVALHELGHVLGLDHESTATAIMAPRISDLYQLQADDIAGANALYGSTALCKFKTLPIDALVRDNLDGSDCRIMDLFGGGTDTSYVDVYKFTLTAPTHLVVDMRSSQLSPVLVLTDGKLKQLDIFEATAGVCVSHMDKTLAAGDYMILANTYTQPKGCGTNQGAYSLSASESAQPVLGDTASTTGGTAAAALITGGATADGGQTYKTSFNATDSIDVSARIAVDPAQVGQSGKVYVLIQASNGARYSKAANGNFVPFTGSLSQMAAYKSGPLSAQESISVVTALKAAGTNLAGLSFAVYVGYALDSQPNAINYGTSAIQFSIGP